MYFKISYESGDGLIQLLFSVVSHVSALHLSKNLSAIMIFITIMYWTNTTFKYAMLLTLSIPVNYLYGTYVHSVMGLSGGTFALLGIAFYVVNSRYKWVAITVLAFHQLTITKPEIAIVHTIAFAIGYSSILIARKERYSRSIVPAPVSTNS